MLGRNLAFTYTNLPNWKLLEEYLGKRNRRELGIRRKLIFVCLSGNFQPVKVLAVGTPPIANVTIKSRRKLDVNGPKLAVNST